MPHARDIADFLDSLLESAGFPDYPGALNGLQLDCRGAVRRVAAAVDFSGRTVDATLEAEANLLILHHGMFWGGAQCITGQVYERLQRLFANDVAVYASHLPLDAHIELGNNARLARALHLEPTARFGKYADAFIGVAGEVDVPTGRLLERADAFARSFGGSARASWMPEGRVTRRWAIISGAGAGSKEIRDAQSQGIDTLIVGEGPHHTTVEAADAGLVIIYAGHYATETLGVCALADVVQEQFGIPATFLLLPTGS